MCFGCFEQKYGKVLLNADRGEYYGGHKVHLAGGTWSDYESGKMYLTEEHFIFSKGRQRHFQKMGNNNPIGFSSNRAMERER